MEQREGFPKAALKAQVQTYEDARCHALTRPKAAGYPPAEMKTYLYAPYEVAGATLTPALTSAGGCAKEIAMAG